MCSVVVRNVSLSLELGETLVATSSVVSEGSHWSCRGHVLGFASSHIRTFLLDLDLEFFTSIPNQLPYLDPTSKNYRYSLKKIKKFL